MKRFTLILLLFALLLSGCSSSSSTPDDANSSPSAEATVEPPTLSTYSDEVINCQYDASLLSPEAHGATTDFSYIWLITSTALSSNEEKANSITDESCIYVFTRDLGFDSSDAYESLPFEITQAFYDAIFSRNPEIPCSISEQSDGCYEYTLSQSGYSFKGKTISINKNIITSVIYRVSDNLSPDLINAFEECYKSITFIQTTLPQPTTLEEHLDWLNKEAEAQAEQAIQITEGSLYDSITAIYPNVKIDDVADSLSIRIYLPHKTHYDDAALFFYILSSICLNCNIEDEYSQVSFSMFVDDSFITNLVLINYTSSSTFVSVEPIVMKDEYEKYISDYYSTYFSSHDNAKTFESNLDSIAEKYGLN